MIARYEAIRCLHLAGADVARRVGVNRQMVYRYRKLEEPPERRQPVRRKTALDPYIPYLLQRWNAGCHNGMQLWREIRAQGYPHTAVATARQRAAPVPTARHVAGLFLRRPAKLTDYQQTYLTELHQQDETVAAAYLLTQHFTEMVRERTGEQLPAWIEQAKESHVGRLRRFAMGLEKDVMAVQAGLTEVWSNG